MIAANAMISVKQLAIAAVLLVVALTPSITDLKDAADSKRHLLPLLWGWIALAGVVLLIAGEELTG